MVRSAAISISELGAADDPLVRLENNTQVAYIRSYLEMLGAKAVAFEPRYFDHDFLAEFSAFYGVSTRGYPNYCGRAHFFRECGLDRTMLRRAASGDREAQRALQEAYLGFVVLRPLESAPLGRTVLAWFPDQTPETPRLTKPSRTYACHLAGFELEVHGLPWQQQDTGVSSCATIALWTLLQSSAFDPHHAIPTTAEITRLANRSGSVGRVFPSDGLEIWQHCEVLKACNLSPFVRDRDSQDGFSPDLFLGLCATLVRSGYPVLLGGRLEDQAGHHEGGHSICVTGFREPPTIEPLPGMVEMHDAKVGVLYVHDDNLGPNVRVRVEIRDGAVRLRPEAPGSPRSRSKRQRAPTGSAHSFVPTEIIAGLHDGLRTDPGALLARAKKDATIFAREIADRGFSYGTRFLPLVDYLGEELEDRLGPGGALARARLRLAEDSSAMSLHLGVVRISVGPVAILDILYDTTDVDDHLRAFTCVAYNKEAAEHCRLLAEVGERQFRHVTRAW